MLCKLLITLLVVLCAKTYAQNALQANWTTCVNSRSRTPITLKAVDVEVYATNCTTDQTECKLYRGQSPKLTIKFKPTKSYRHIERGIVADIYMSALGRTIQVPYGAVVDPCLTMTSDDDNTTTCQSTGIIKDKSYTYVSEFKVLDDFPQVSGIRVRVMLRQKLRNHRSLRQWSRHPEIIMCAELHNVAVV